MLRRPPAGATGSRRSSPARSGIEAITLAAEAEGRADSDAALWVREQRLIERMQEIADESRHLPDAKTRRLIDWIREQQCTALPPFGRRTTGGTPPGWNTRRVLIFTENREGTKRHLRDVLEQAIETTDRSEERIEVIDGLTSGARRKEIQRRFNTDPAKDPLRILIASAGCGTASATGTPTISGAPSRRRIWTRRRSARPRKSSRRPATARATSARGSNAAAISSMPLANGRALRRSLSATPCRARWSCWTRRRSPRAGTRWAVRCGLCRRFISEPPPTRAGPRPWIRSARPAGSTRSSPIGAGTRRSGRWSSRTPAN